MILAGIAIALTTPVAIELPHLLGATRHLDAARASFDDLGAVADAAEPLTLQLAGIVSKGLCVVLGVMVTAAALRLEEPGARA